jgi:hypothetical protein
MKPPGLTLWLAGMLAVLASVPAFAHGHVRWGVSIGVPLFPPAYYWGPPPAYYYPPVVAAPAAPVTYIEQAPPQASADQSSWWYYCAGARTYYPYVKECPGGWQRVAPQPR